MAESKENVKETEVSQEGDTQVVRQRTSSTSSEDTKRLIANAIWYIVGFIEVLLAFRFALKLFGANPDAGFVTFVYNVSNIFAGPFTGTFSTPTTKGDIVKSMVELGTLLAMIVYAIVAWGLTKLLTLNRRTS